MKTKKTPYHFYSDVYFQNFYFCLGWKRSEFKDYFGLELGENARGMTFLTVGGIVIWIESDKFLGSLVHECIHANNFLFSQRGIIASNKNDEAQAYFTQWIFENCLKKFKKKR